MTPVPANHSPEIRLGLGPNLAQFTLLIVVNAFVGAMVGMERTLLPPIAEQEFHLAARTAVLSFIVVFGVTKALTNYLAVEAYEVNRAATAEIAALHIAPLATNPPSKRTGARAPSRSPAAPCPFRLFTLPLARSSARSSHPSGGAQFAQLRRASRDSKFWETGGG